MWAEEATKEQLYLRALEQHQQKRYREARTTWRRLLGVLKREQLAQAQGSRAWHLMTVGQIDAMHYVAEASWQLAEKQMACLQLKQQQEKESTLPTGWEMWPIQPSLLLRNKASRARLMVDCPRVPSLVRLVVTPAQTQVTFQDPTGRWRTWQGGVLETIQPQFHLKARAVGFVDQEIVQKLEHWQVHEIIVRMRALRREPATRPASLPPPTQRKRIASILHKPPLIRRDAPIPFYRTWWFWTITGVAVTGGVVAVVLVATHEPRYHLKGETPNQGYRVW